MLLKDPLGMYHPPSFAEDDKLRPGKDVTSSKRCKISFKKQKICESIWPTLQVFEIKKRDKKGHKKDTQIPDSEEQSTRRTFRGRKVAVCVVSPRTMPLKTRKRHRTHRWLIPETRKTR